ncbi:MAG: hypothetical protein ACXWFT_05440 [Actinomycetota bacterium]
MVLSSQDALELGLLGPVPTGNYLLDPAPRSNAASPPFGMQVAVAFRLSVPVGSHAS